MAFARRFRLAAPGIDPLEHALPQSALGFPMNLIAADVTRLTILPGKIRADSHRLLRFRGTKRASLRGVLSRSSPHSLLAGDGELGSSAALPIGLNLFAIRCLADYGSTS